MHYPTALLLATLAFPTPGFANNDGERDIIETAVAAGSFKTLAAALEAGGLVKALRGEGPFTVFAPSDAAFAKLPKGTLESLLKPENKSKLVEILTYHVVPGRVSAIQALQAGSATTLQKSKVSFSLEKGQLRVSGRRVVQNDIHAKNGVIHVIDEVLIPKRTRPAYRRMSGGDFIRLAVEKGVPLFNDGQQGACVAVYEVTIRAVLDFDETLVSTKTRTALKAALAKAREQDTAAAQAWTLRRALDGAWRELATSEAEAVSRESHDEVETPTSTTETEASAMLFTFADDEAAWTSVNDDVMGGISKGGFSFGNNGTGVFAGALSRENNGGFATVRSPAKDLELDGFDGVVLRVRGDGRTYRFSALKNDGRWETRTWQASFETEAGTYTEVKIPFPSLRLRIMGRWVRGKSIRPRDIKSFSFGIADKNEEPFRLEIDSIRAYRAAR